MGPNMWNNQNTVNLLCTTFLCTPNLTTQFCFNYCASKQQNVLHHGLTVQQNKKWKEEKQVFEKKIYSLKLVSEKKSMCKWK
jgi:hypothetical protein